MNKHEEKMLLPIFVGTCCLRFSLMSPKGFSHLLVIRESDTSDKVIKRNDEQNKGNDCG